MARFAAFVIVTVSATAAAQASIPATPLMTVYQFNGPAKIPYYEIESFVRRGPALPAGSLTQGTAVIPCLVIRDGVPVTERDGTPYVGFEVVIDSNTALPEATARFEQVWAQRQTLLVDNHHCPADTAHVIDVRRLFALSKPPRFEPPQVSPATVSPGRTERDTIIRAFHASRHCALANERLVGRREALQRAWSAFTVENAARWPAKRLTEARHLDFVMRTAIYEAHFDRGCGAYGACERNVIALSIRNRAVERCLGGQGCRSPGDFEGVASAVSQYNIWDELLTQTTGLTSCFLRPGLAESNAKLQALYEQSAGDVERILFGDARDLSALFAGAGTAQLARLRHYYHPPAMGKCFPQNPDIEYISGAVARRGETFALIANRHVQVGERRGEDYTFQPVTIENRGGRDILTPKPYYSGFVIDGRKIELAPATRCTPYGVARACRFDRIDRYRKTPSWLDTGEPLAIACRVHARGEDCRAAPRRETTTVGGKCDTEMQPVGDVP